MSQFLAKGVAKLKLSSKPLLDRGGPRIRSFLGLKRDKMAFKGLKQGAEAEMALDGA